MCSRGSPLCNPLRELSIVPSKIRVSQQLRIRQASQTGWPVSPWSLPVSALSPQGSQALATISGFWHGFLSFKHWSWCWRGKHFTHWAVSLAPKTWFPLYPMQLLEYNNASVPSPMEVELPQEHSHGLFGFYQQSALQRSQQWRHRLYEDCYFTRDGSNAEKYLFHIFPRLSPFGHSYHNKLELSLFSRRCSFKHGMPAAASPPPNPRPTVTPASQLFLCHYSGLA